MLTNAVLLIGEGALYFGAMAALFRLRHRVGVGLFMCALGVMHFLETYLASVFYVALPAGIVSPGSVVLFSGKLVMLLLLYIKEDAAAVRQPIYGLLVGNFLMVGFGLVLRQHQLVDLPSGNKPDIAFLDQMGGLMLWGTSLLYVDAIALILLYEKLGRWLRSHLVLRIATATCCVLTFDQLAFFVGLHVATGAPFSALIGGWVAKMGASLAYSLALVAYLRLFETATSTSPRGLGDLFDRLTYRERYEALVESASRDALTGLLHRGRFDLMAQKAVEASRLTGAPLSLIIVDIDHFKAINDRFGHAEGDRILKAIARVLVGAASPGCEVFRLGGEEFALLSPYPAAVARLLGEHLRLSVLAFDDEKNIPVTVSIGLAGVTEKITTLSELFAAADACLYAAKAGGRNQVVAHDERYRALPARRNGASA